MGIIFNRKPCTNCGNTTFHRECFSGGSKTSLSYSEKDLKAAARQVAFNEAQGKKGDARFKGVNKDLLPMLKFNGGDVKDALDEARKNYKGKKK